MKSERKASIAVIIFANKVQFQSSQPFKVVASILLRRGLAPTDDLVLLLPSLLPLAIGSVGAPKRLWHSGLQSVARVHELTRRLSA